MPRVSPEHNTDLPMPTDSDTPLPTQEPAEPFCAQCHAFALARCSESVKFSQRRFCDTHRRERMRSYVSGTPEKKAANYMRAMASKDRRIFGQQHTKMSRQDILSLFSSEQLENYVDWMIMPRDPAHTLVAGNAVLVKKPTRSFLLCEWKRHRDPVEYMKKLDALMASVDV